MDLSNKSNKSIHQWSNHIDSMHLTVNHLLKFSK